MSAVDSLPQVELAYSYPGGTGPKFDKAPAGIAVQSNGFTREESGAYSVLRRAGTVVVTVFAGGDNMSAAGGGGARPGGAVAGAMAGASRPDSARAVASAPAAGVTPMGAQIVAQHLTPAKARILLMVALTHTKDARELQRMFLQY